MSRRATRSASADRGAAILQRHHRLDRHGLDRLDEEPLCRLGRGGALPSAWPRRRRVDASFPWDAGFLHYFVREPFPSRTTSARWSPADRRRRGAHVEISEMAENGVIFSDGIEADFLEFNSGTEARIGVAEKQGILVM